MKNIIGALFIVVLLAFPARADDFKFYGAKWDSMAPVLGITPYYGELDSDTTATSVEITMSLYKEGKFVREIHTGSMGNKASRLKLKFALFFTDHVQQKKDYAALEWEGRGDMGGPMNVSDVSLTNGGSCFALPFTKIEDKTPIFAIITNTNHITSASTPETIVKEHPGATILIGYLVIKQ